MSTESGNNRLISTPTSLSKIHANSPTIFRFLIQKNKPTQSATINLTLWIHHTEEELRLQFSAIARKKVSHFSNLKFLFITAEIFARFDSILFCEKFEINFEMVSFGPPVLTKFSPAISKTTSLNGIFTSLWLVGYCKSRTMNFVFKINIMLTMLSFLLV